jgi:hypothetical protein
MRNRIVLPFIAIAVLAGAWLVGCDGELSDGLPEVIESSGDSCNSCHQSPPAPPHPTDDRCYACHAETVGSDGQTIAGGTHLNKNVEYAVTGCDVCHAYPPAAPHSDVTVCAPCHAASVTAEEKIDWDGGKHANGTVEVAVTAASCELCHGYPPADPHPQSDDCATCHGTTVGADGLLLADSDAHNNGQVDIVVAGGSCDLCHGFPPAAPHPSATGCNDCHSSTVDDALDIIGDNHLNGSVDLKLTTDSCGKCHAMPPADGHPNKENCGQCHGCVADDDWNLINEELHMNGQTDFASPPNCP